jgi:hypothetical protein
MRTHERRRQFMAKKSKLVSKEKTVRLKLECLRTAQSLLPREPAPLRRRWYRAPAPSAAKVMNLACALYRWISDEAPRSRRLQEASPLTEETMKKLRDAILAELDAQDRRKFEARRRRRERKRAKLVVRQLTSAPAPGAEDSKSQLEKIPEVRLTKVL